MGMIIKMTIGFIRTGGEKTSTGPLEIGIETILTDLEIKDLIIQGGMKTGSKGSTEKTDQ